MSSATTLAALAAQLRCPQCGASLHLAGRALACPRGHSFDVARQGHVSLPPSPRAVTGGDSEAMVAAREAFLSAGHFAPIADAVVAAARAATGAHPAPLVVDLGAGTGYYLAALLDALADAAGVALDASAAALRRAVRAHERIAAIVCDIWQELPLQPATADLIVNVFAPRNAPEIARVLAPGGRLLVVTPTVAHLHQLVPALGLLDVGADKQARLRDSLQPELAADVSRGLEFDMTLRREQIRTLVAMGPSAHHVGADVLDRRIGELPEELAVTASVVVQTFRRATASDAR